MKIPPPACIDCRHCFFEEDQKSPKCELASTKHFNPLWGSSVKFSFCEEERSENGACKSTGENFEYRPYEPNKEEEKRRELRNAAKMKPCRTCLYMRNQWWDTFVGRFNKAICAHPKTNSGTDQNSSKDFVSGTLEKWTCPCWIKRKDSSENSCGPLGKWWEPK